VVISKVGFQVVMDQTNSLKPASKSLVIPLINAARGSAPDHVEKTTGKASGVGPRPSIAIKGVKESTTMASLPPPSPKHLNRSETPVQDNRPASRIGGIGLGRPTRPIGLGGATSKIASSPVAKRVVSQAVPAPVQEQEAPLLSSDPKFKAARRSKDETGPLKWVIENVARPDQIEYLQHQCSSQFSSNLNALLFSKDQHAEKDFLAGLTLLDECSFDEIACEKFDVSLEEMKDRFVCNADLILKYTTIRLSESNTTINMKTLDLLEHLFGILTEMSYSLSEYEAQAFVPTLISKVICSSETLYALIRLLH
jgi:cytoskeleton-associated protein 5